MSTTFACDLRCADQEKAFHLQIRKRAWWSTCSDVQIDEKSQNGILCMPGTSPLLMRFFGTDIDKKSRIVCSITKANSKITCINGVYKKSRTSRNEMVIIAMTPGTSKI